jgi:hypothetical protein
MSADVLSDGPAPNGTWRVERKLTRAFACKMIVYDRRFDGESRDGPVDNLRVAAEASSRLDQLDPVVTEQNTPTGETADWWAYRLPPGFRGLFTARVGADGCENGYSGWFVLYTATVP